MFCFELVKSEMPIRHPNGNAQQTLVYISLEIRNEVRTWDRNSAGICIGLTCEVKELDEIIQGEC